MRFVHDSHAKEPAVKRHAKRPISAKPKDKTVRTSRTVRYLRFVVVVGIAAIFALAYSLSENFRVEVARAVGILGQGDVGVLRDYLLSFGALAPLASVAAMILQALIAPVPVFLVVFANGLTFGVLWGWLLSLAGLILASTVCFWISRSLGRGPVEALAGKAGLESADRWFARWGVWAVLFARLVPGMAFDAVSFAAGLSRMGFGRFLVATVVGSAPSTFIYAYLGRQAPQYVWALLALTVVVIGGVGLVAYLRRRKASGESKRVDASSRESASDDGTPSGCSSVSGSVASNGLSACRPRRLAKGLVRSNVTRCLAIMVVLVVILTVTIGGSTAAEGQDESRELDTTAVDRFVDEHLEKSRIPGMEVAIIKDDEAVYVAGYGHDSTGAPGSGGVVSTAEDLGRWMIVQNNEGPTADGTRLISARSIEEMHTPPRGDTDYGMGWREGAPAGEPRRISHGGAMPIFASYQGLFPESGYGIAVLSNSGLYPLYEDTYPVVRAVNEIIEGETPRPAASVASIGDGTLAVLTLGPLAMGLLGLIRARMWASRRSNSPRWRTVLRMLPYQIPFIILAAVFTCIFALGYDLSVAVSFSFLWPAFTIWLVVDAISGMAVSVARAIELWKRGLTTPFFRGRERR